MVCLPLFFLTLFAPQPRQPPKSDGNKSRKPGNKEESSRLLVELSHGRQAARTNETIGPVLALLVMFNLMKGDGESQDQRLTIIGTRRTVHQPCMYLHLIPSRRIWEQREQSAKSQDRDARRERGGWIEEKARESEREGELPTAGSTVKECTCRR